MSTIMSTLEGYASDSSDMDLDSDPPAPDVTETTESGGSAMPPASPLPGRPIDTGRIFALMQEIMGDDTVVNTIDDTQQSIGEKKESTEDNAMDEDRPLGDKDEPQNKVGVTAGTPASDGNEDVVPLSASDHIDNTPGIPATQSNEDVIPPAASDHIKNPPVNPASKGSEEVVTPTASGSTSRKVALRVPPRMRRPKPLSHIGMLPLQCC
jgi:hypothetical protein